MDVDALGVHVDQTLRVAERNVARQVPFGRCRERRSLHQVPDLRHERMRVNVHGLDATTADDDLTPFAWRGTNLRGCEAGIGKASPRDEHCGRGARELSQKGSAIAHGLLLAPSRLGIGVPSRSKSDVDAEYS